jgi:hypothetical protein
MSPSDDGSLVYQYGTDRDAALRQALASLLDSRIKEWVGSHYFRATRTRDG